MGQYVVGDRRHPQVSSAAPEALCGVHWLSVFVCGLKVCIAPLPSPLPTLRLEALEFAARPGASVTSAQPCMA